MNPAAELLQIFETWLSRPTPASHQINLNNSAHRKEAVKAVRLTEQIAEILEILEQQGQQVDVYKQPLLRWQQACFHFGHSWIQTGISVQHIDMLKALSVYLGIFLPQFQATEEAIRSRQVDLLAMLREVQHALIDDSELDRSFVSHVQWLIEHITNTLESEDEIDLLDFNESVRLLRVYVEAASVRTTDEGKREKFMKFVNDFFSHPFANTSMAILGSVAVGQLPAGQ